MQDVPASYLLWLWNDNGGKPDNARNGESYLVMKYIEENMDALRKEHPDTIVKGIDE